MKLNLNSEERERQNEKKPGKRLWGSIKKLNLNSGESEVGDEKKSVRRRFRSWRCCQTWTLRKEESAIKKSRQSDKSARRRMKLWGSGRKPRMEKIPKKDKRSVFWITLSLCPLLTPLCTPQSPCKNNDNFSAHFKLKSTISNLLDMIHA